MKILKFFQALLTIALLGFGIVLTFSEVPETASVIEQIKVSGGGILLVLAAVGMLLLMDWEEKRFEAR